MKGQLLRWKKGWKKGLLGGCVMIVVVIGVVALFWLLTTDSAPAEEVAPATSEWPLVLDEDGIPIPAPQPTHDDP